MQRRNDKRKYEEDGGEVETSTLNFRKKEQSYREEDGMWDDDFTRGKFQLGRVIERNEVEQMSQDLSKLALNEKKNRENL